MASEDTRIRGFRKTFTHKTVKYTKAICLNVFDHFVGLTLEGL